jgi:AcrR family transcriptional regulator
MVENPVTVPRRPGRPRLMAETERRRAVLEAAIAVLADDGFHGATMEAVAARAGVPKASCYEAFPSKEALFAAAVTSVDAELNAALAASHEQSQGSAPAARVRRRFGALFDFARRRPASFRLLMLSLFHRTEATDRAHASMREAALDRLAADIRHGAEQLGVPGDHVDRLFASVLFGLAGGALRAVAADPDLDADAVADLLTQFTLAGLSALSRETLASIARQT